MSICVSLQLNQIIIAVQFIVQLGIVKLNVVSFLIRGSYMLFISMLDWGNLEPYDIRYFKIFCKKNNHKYKGKSLKRDQLQSAY